jgi:hypothetical protein
MGSGLQRLGSALAPSFGTGSLFRDTRARTPCLPVLHSLSSSDNAEGPTLAVNCTGSASGQPNFGGSLCYLIGIFLPPCKEIERWRTL